MHHVAESDESRQKQRLLKEHALGLVEMQSEKDFQHPQGVGAEVTETSPTQHAAVRLQVPPHQRPAADGEQRREHQERAAAVAPGPPPSHDGKDHRCGEVLRMEPGEQPGDEPVAGPTPPRARRRAPHPRDERQDGYAARQVRVDLRGAEDRRHAGDDTQDGEPRRTGRGSRASSANCPGPATTTRAHTGRAVPRARPRTPTGQPPERRAPGCASATNPSPWARYARRPGPISRASWRPTSSCCAAPGRRRGQRWRT